MIKSYALTAGIAVVALVGGSAYFVWDAKSADRFGACVESSVAGGDIGGPFELTRHDGVRVTDKDVITGLTLIYFGYTYCPDVCPVDTARLAEVTEILDARGIEVTPVMITIDPARDTPEVMADYVDWLHPRMIGLTGTEEEIRVVAKETYRAYFAKAGTGEDYLMDHTAYTYLVAPEYGFLDFYRRDVSADALADHVACFAAKI